MEQDPARIALNLCDELYKLHDLLWDIYYNQFLDLISEKYDDPACDDASDNPF